MMVVYKMWVCTIYSRYKIRSQGTVPDAEADGSMRAESATQFELPFQPFTIAFNSPYAATTRLAICSLERTGQNWLKTVQMVGPSVVNEAIIPVSLPITACMFSPFPTRRGAERLITTSESLKVWDVSADNLTVRQNVIIDEARDPLTCVDWSLISETVALSGSSGGEAFAVDLQEGTCLARIVAHDHAINDAKFCGPTTTFVTAGFDGSCRFFDLRDLASSFVYFQAAFPLQRVETSALNGYIATFGKGNCVSIIDSRKPGMVCSVVKLGAPITSVKWSKISVNSLIITDASGAITTADVIEGTTVAESAQIYQCAGIPQSMTITPAHIAVTLQESIEIIKMTEPVVPQTGMQMELLGLF